MSNLSRSGPNGHDLKSVRRQARELQDQRQALDQAPPPLDELAADVRSHVAELALAGAPGAHLLGQTSVLPNGRRTAISITPLADPLALAAWFDPDRLVRRLANFAQPTGQRPRTLDAGRTRRAHRGLGRRNRRTRLCRRKPGLRSAGQRPNHHTFRIGAAAGGVGVRFNGVAHTRAA